MGLDREKVLAAAERQLKSGRGSAALVELRKLAASEANDLALLNRIGDLCARHDERDPAIEFYSRAAEQFSRTGLYPKAIAVGKKILRLDPDRIETLIRVGEWYLEQRLPGEARSYLLHAADKCLDGSNFARAREVYERMVAAEPRDPRHRVRLAEALASEGRTDEAGEHLLALGRTLRSGAGAESREGVFRRAMELLPGREEPVLGLVGTLVEAGRQSDAVDCLEARQRDGILGPALLAELAALYDVAGRGEEAMATLASIPAAEMPDQTLERILRARIERGQAAGFWDRLGDALSPSEADPDANPLRLRVLARLADLEPAGHVPALERLAAWHEFREDPRAVALLERLHGALEAAGQVDAARDVLDRLTAPDDTVADVAPVPEAAPETVARDEDDAVASEAAGETVVQVDLTRVPVAAEAPAVPLNRTDEEFVGGRITQAEILEKYGLRDKAVEQVREIVARFPGHVEGQRRLVRLMEDGGAAVEVRDALVGLALALRAAGDGEGARDAARRASESAPLEDDVADVLSALGLRPIPEADGEGPSESAIEDGQTVQWIADDPTPAVDPPAAMAAPDDDEVVIEFDDDAEMSLPAAGTVAGAPTDAAPPVTAAASGPEPATADDGISDDLADLARALESELFDAGDDEPILPEAPTEQSLDEVLAAFRSRVREEVDAEDFRTRYDLAIGYKEMGMLDEAVSEFEVTAGSPELAVESCVMIAVIRREQGDLDGAVRWYRSALEASARTTDGGPGLRYELADALERAGQVEEALREFRDLSAAAPSFRDVDTRISEIEGRLQS